MPFEQIETGKTLSYLGFKLFRPSRLLRQFVRNYWVIDTPQTLLATHTEHLYPEAGMGVIFNLAEPLTLNRRPERVAAFFDGTHSRAVHLSLSLRIHALGIRFHPGGAFPFFLPPLHEINNATAALTEVGHSEVEEVCDRLCLAKSLNERLQVLDTWLLNRLAAAGAPVRSALTTRAVAELKRQAGDLVIGQLCDQLGVSRRQLERVFRTHVGLSPKTVANIYRVEHARALICALPDISLTEIGYRAGYYDQSHFVHDFNRIVDETPSAYKRRKHGRAT